MLTEKPIGTTEQVQNALLVAWRTKAEDESSFKIMLQAFVDCFPTSQDAGRKLLLPPTTLQNWLKGRHAPRAHYRASFRARIIEVLNEWNEVREELSGIQLSFSFD